MAVSAAPFVASAYGLLYERTAIEVTHQRIKLRRLPKAFDGFRLAQLSDIHIGPFMPADEIRRCVLMVNQLKPDLVALTGDFIAWDASTEGAVVEALGARTLGRRRGLSHPALRGARRQDSAPRTGPA